jgi:hypothetical protein
VTFSVFNDVNENRLYGTYYSWSGTDISVVDPDPKDPKLFAGSGSVTRGYGSGSGFGSETRLESY